MKKIAEGIKYWGQLLLLPIYWFSFLFPRSKNIWLFGSTFGKRFADNPRYFYLYISQMTKKLADTTDDVSDRDSCMINGKPIRSIWISHSKEIVEFLQQNGYEAYYHHSIQGIWYCLRGKVYCFDNYSKDISFWLSGGALKLNMWHGVGNKCINFDNKHDKVRHPKNAWEKFKYFPRRLSDEKPSHYILSTSPMMSEIFARAFQVPMEHVIEAGYPRNDVLYEDMQNCNDSKTKIHNIYLPGEQVLMDEISAWREQGLTVLGYLPTFRPSETKLFEVCNLDELNLFFQEHDMKLVCKLHPKSGCKQAFEKIEYSNIYVVPAEVDVNAFLGKLDVLIADYSSVYSDYMLLDRPVVAFHYDYADYAADTRDAYFDWDEYMPEVRAFNQDDLENAIMKVLKKDDMQEPRRRFRDKLYAQADGDSAGKVFCEIREVITKKCERK